MTTPAAKAVPGTLHRYAPGLTAFEHATTVTASSSETPQAKNYIIWLGGLYDGLCTAAYPRTLHRTLNASPSTSAPWVVVEPLLSSSYTGWQASSLEAGVTELADCVAHFRALQADTSNASTAKIILMGHSTGCQIATHYLIGPWSSPAIPAATLARPKVDGVILQAGISDREATNTLSAADNYAIRAGMEQARALIAAGEPQTRVRGVESTMFGASTAKRLLSLVSSVPAEADDDYFSSDLDDARVQRVWGKAGLAGRGVRIMVCLSGADQYMPAAVDKEALAGRWGAAVRESGGVWDERSGVVAGASHNLDGDDESVVVDLCERVAGFVAELE